MADDQSIDHGATLMAWTIPEYERHARSIGWYILAVLAGIALLVWAFITASYLFAIIILMVAVILYRQASRTPATLHFALTEDGLELGDRHFYSYKDLATFWIVYEPPDVKRLFFTFKSSVRPYLAVPIENQNPVAIRKTLQRYIAEDLEREGEPATDAFGRSLKL